MMDYVLVSMFVPKDTVTPLFEPSWLALLVSRDTEWLYVTRPVRAWQRQGNSSGRQKSLRLFLQTR